jgi:hypothetical protein
VKIVEEQKSEGGKTQ